MSEYGHYVTYRSTTAEAGARMTQDNELRLARRDRRRTRRHAVARRLHSLADRLDG